MSSIQFGKITIMKPVLVEEIKRNIHTLPERDAFIGSHGKHDPELAKGNYQWYTLPNKSELIVSGPHIRDFQKFQNQNEVPLQKDMNQYYAALEQRVANYLSLKKQQGEKIYTVPAPTGLRPFWVAFKLASKRPQSESSMPST